MTTMPCPRGCATVLDPTTPCTECGHHLTLAEQRHLEHKDRGRAAIAQARAHWEQWKHDHPRTTTSTRRTA